LRGLFEGVLELGAGLGFYCLVRSCVPNSLEVLLLILWFICNIDNWT